ANCADPPALVARAVHGNVGKVALYAADLVRATRRYAYDFVPDIATAQNVVARFYGDCTAAGREDRIGLEPAVQVRFPQFAERDLRREIGGRIHSQAADGGAMG